MYKRILVSILILLLFLTVLTACVNNLQTLCTLETSELVYSSSSYEEPPPTGLAVHRILLVFVSEIAAYHHAPQSPQRRYFVNHRLSDLERQIAVMTTQFMQNYLNLMLEGIVTFEVSYFFTTQPIVQETLFAHQIPEVADLIRNYDAVITSTSAGIDANHVLGNYNNQIVQGGWVDWDNPKHAWVNIDALTVTPNWLLATPFREERLSNFKAMLDLDENHELWQRLLYLYIHEFVHTAGNRVHNIRGWERSDMFHEVLFQFPQATMDMNGVIHLNNFWVYELKAAQLYLRDEAYYEGRLVGVPREFWYDPHNFSDFRS